MSTRIPFAAKGWRLLLEGIIESPCFCTAKNRGSILEIGNLRRFQLKLQFVSNQGNKFRIRGLAFRVADGIAEKSLQSIQVASVPGYLDGMADSPFHSGRGSLECLCHLGVEHLGDGVGVLTAHLGAFWMGSVKPP